MYPADCRTWAAALCRIQEASDGFLWETADLKYLHVMQNEDLSIEEAFDWDDSKLVILRREPG